MSAKYAYKSFKYTQIKIEEGRKEGGKSRKPKKDDEETKSNFSFRKLLLDFVISEDSCHVSTVSV